MMLNKILTEIPTDKPEFPEGETYLNQRIDRLVSPIKYMATNLYPTILESGLIASLQWLACDFEEKNHIPLQFSSNVSEIRLDPLLTIGLFNIAQEACNNVSKHANASSVEMYLYYGEHKLQLEIIDNGLGMETLQQHSIASRGLRKMNERAISMGGDFTIASAKGKGTLIRICVPLFPD